MLTLMLPLLLTQTLTIIVGNDVDSGNNNSHRNNKR